MSKADVGFSPKEDGHAVVEITTISKDVEAAAILNDVGGIDHERREGMASFSKASNVRHWMMDCSQVWQLKLKVTDFHLTHPPWVASLH